MNGRGSEAPRGVLAGVASAVVTLTFIVALAAAGGLFAYMSRGPAAQSGEATTVVLRKGAGLAEIAGELSTARVIPSAPLFIALAEVTGSAHRIKSGEYLIPSRASVSDILRKLRAGDIVRHKITVPEGASSKQIRDLLTKSDVLVGDTPEVAEGSVLPETYDVTRGESRSAVALRMTAATSAEMRRNWS